MRSEVSQRASKSLLMMQNGDLVTDKVIISN